MSFSCDWTNEITEFHFHKTLALYWWKNVYFIEFCIDLLFLVEIFVLVLFQGGWKILHFVMEKQCKQFWTLPDYHLFK